MKLVLSFENEIDSKRGKNLYNRYRDALSDEDITLSETGLSVELENIHKGSSPIISTLTKQLDAMAVRDITELVDEYEDISQVFPANANEILREYKRTHNDAFLCTAICKKLASDAMNCGNGNEYSNILAKIELWGDGFAKQSREMGIDGLAYNQDIMVRVTGINVLIDIMFTFIPVTRMNRVLGIINGWNDLPMCVHRIPQYKYDAITDYHLVRPTNLRLIVDEEYDKYPKTKFIFKYADYQKLCAKFNDIYGFVQNHKIISKYRDPTLTSFLIDKLNALSEEGVFPEQCDSFRKEIIEQCGSLLKEPV